VNHVDDLEANLLSYGSELNSPFFRYCCGQ
jgi:hypothetical protein